MRSGGFLDFLFLLGTAVNLTVGIWPMPIPTRERTVKRNISGDGLSSCARISGYNVGYQYQCRRERVRHYAHGTETRQATRRSVRETATSYAHIIRSLRYSISLAP